MNMAVDNTLFKKRASHLVTYETGPSKTQVDYFLVRSNQKLLKDRKALPSDDYLSQSKPLVCEFKIRKVKDPRRKFVPRRMIWKLEAKKKARRAVYLAKCKAEKKDDDYVFNIVKTIVRINQDITG